MPNRNLLAFDLGASNGRAILGRFDGKRITLEELHRFENNFISLNGVLYWNVLDFYQQMKAGFSAFAQLKEGDLHAFGVDTWGVDYGLLDKNGALLGNPRCYREALDADMEAAYTVVPKETLFARTGLASMNFNTVYQLYRRKREGDAALDAASCMLLMPDLLGYFFTGERGSEYTNVTTSMLYNPVKKDWDYETIRALGLPERIFTHIDRAGTLRGRLLPDVASELSLNQAAFAAVGTHDTASAVAAIPGEGDFAFCSSGTWSLFGVETDAPILTDDVFRSSFSNEGTVQGGFRPLKNIMGLWIIQECRRDWIREGKRLSWDDIVDAARQAAPFRSIIDPDYQEFFGSGSMVRRIQAYCKKTNQPIPETTGEVARCIYESLALKYRWALHVLETLKGRRLNALNLVGGGIQNKLLNQMTADSIDRPVFTGPTEGACIGNLLMQAVALGELNGIDDVRTVVRDSIEVETYTPHHTDAWEDAYARLMQLMEAGKNA